MNSLDRVQQQNVVFVLEIDSDLKTEKHLESLGILPSKMMTVIRNESVKTPLIVEVDNTRFALSRSIAEQIVVSDVLDHQELIFEGNQTKQRQTILEVLKGCHNHFTFEELFVKIKQVDEKIGQVTLYRTLKVLVGRGVVEELELPEGGKKFEVKKGHHDHIICKNCGAIIEFHDEDMEALQEKIAKKHGIELGSHRMQLFGEHCKACNKI